MTKPILYLLAPGFEDNDRREYCPECAEMWGVLSYFPAIKEAMNIRYMPIDRPRVPMVEMLGEAHQNCPTLVLDAKAEIPIDVRTKLANGHTFIDNARDIGVYFAHNYGTPFPRGTY